MKTKPLARKYIVLLILYKKAQAGLTLTNAELADRYAWGYAQRNDLCQTGAIETGLGVKLIREERQGENFTRYSVHPSYIDLAREILIKKQLIRG
jgi:hypothetical protein